MKIKYTVSITLIKNKWLKHRSCSSFLVTLLNVILNTYQDKRRSDSWQIMLVYLLTYRKNILRGGQKSLSTFIKYNLVQTQEPTRDNRCLCMRNVHIPHD